MGSEPNYDAALEAEIDAMGKPPEPIDTPLQFTLRCAISSKDGIVVTFIEGSMGVQLQQIWYDSPKGSAIILDEQSARDLALMLNLWLNTQPK